MPTYVYRCPDRHEFEAFHKMSEDGPTSCEVCDKEPVERVLFPVAVHFKGSGFYTTDYGRGDRTGEGGDGDGSSGDEKKSADSEKSKSDGSSGASSDSSSSDSSGGESSKRSSESSSSGSSDGKSESKKKPADA